MYVIWGRYGAQEEQIDETSSREEAETLLGEYRMAFGDNWELWIGGPYGEA